MSELSVKSTRRKFQGFFKMCLKSHFAPTAFVGASDFVKPTRRLFFVILLTYAPSVSTRIKAVTIRAGIEPARVSHYLPHSLKSATISRHIRRPIYRAGIPIPNWTSVVSMRLVVISYSNLV
jgi:hypothetical protein